MSRPPFLDKSVLDYVICITPFVLGHVIVPPLEIFYGAKPPDGAIEMYSSILGEYFDRRKIEAWLLAPYHERTPQQWILHLFVHGSYEHLITNLSALINFGYPVFQEMGGLGLCAVFLLGGIAAAIPSELHEQQERTVEKEIENYIQVQGDKYKYVPGFLKVPDFMKEKFRVLSKQLGMRPSILVPEEACGSSGASCALCGCILVFSCRDILLTTYNILQPRRYRSSTNKVKKSSLITKKSDADLTTTPSTDESKNMVTTNTNNTWEDYVYTVLENIQESIRKSTLTTKRAVFVKIIRMYHMSHYLISEVSYIFSSSGHLPPVGTDASAHSESAVDVTNLWKIIEYSRIGHAAHVQGFLFGAAFAMVFGIGVPAIQRRLKYTF